MSYAHIKARAAWGRCVARQQLAHAIYRADLQRWESNRARETHLASYVYYAIECKTLIELTYGVIL